MVYIFFPAVFQYRSVFFSSFKHRYIIRLDAHRRTIRECDTIYIYKYIYKPPDLQYRGGTSGIWLICDLAWPLAGCFDSRGNNSVSKKTVLPVSEGQGGAERVFSIYVRTLPLLLLQRRWRYKTLSGRPSLNLLNDVHRDSKSSEYTFLVVFADMRVRVIKNDCISYTVHDHSKRVGQRLGEEQSYWRRPIGGKNAQTYPTNVILSRSAAIA